MNRFSMSHIIFCALAFVVLQSPSALGNGNHHNNHQNNKNHHNELRKAKKIDRLLAQIPKSFQFTNLLNVSLGPNVAAEGGAFLVRSKNQLEARIMAADLNAGNAYSLWFIVFNDPSKCANTPCADTDLAGAGGAVHYGSGAIAGANGVINVTMHASAGGPPAGAAGNPTLPERGLVKNQGFNAEVHLLVVDHGRPMTADFSAQQPDVPGTWGWELTHPLPPGPTWVRGAIFKPES